jgi:hypothetical protein
MQLPTSVSKNTLSRLCIKNDTTVSRASFSDLYSSFTCLLHKNKKSTKESRFARDYRMIAIVFMAKGMTFHFPCYFAERFERLKKVLWRCSVHEQRCSAHEQRDNIDETMKGSENEGEMHRIILGRMTCSMLLGEVPKDEGGKFVQFDSLRCVQCV